MGVVLVGVWEMMDMMNELLGSQLRRFTDEE